MICIDEVLRRRAFVRRKRPLSSNEVGAGFALSREMPRKGCAGWLPCFFPVHIICINAISRLAKMHKQLGSCNCLLTQVSWQLYVGVQLKRLRMCMVLGCCLPFCPEERIEPRSSLFHWCLEMNAQGHFILFVRLSDLLRCIATMMQPWTIMNDPVEVRSSIHAEMSTAWCVHHGSIASSSSSLQYPGSMCGLTNHAGIHPS